MRDCFPAVKTIIHDKRDIGFGIKPRPDELEVLSSGIDWQPGHALSFLEIYRNKSPNGSELSGDDGEANGARCSRGLGSLSHNLQIHLHKDCNRIVLTKLSCRLIGFHAVAGIRFNVVKTNRVVQRVRCV